MRFRNRVQLLQAVLGSVVLLVVFCGVGLIALAPDSPTRRWPLLLTIFFLALVLGLLGIGLLLRWLLRLPSKPSQQFFTRLFTGATV
jgi:ABC-type sugar transport system permease subunit